MTDVSNTAHHPLVCAWLSADCKFNSCHVGVDEVDVIEETSEHFCVQLHPTDTTQTSLILKDSSNGYIEPKAEEIKSTHTHIMLLLYSDKGDSTQELTHKLVEHANKLMRSHQRLKNYQINDELKIQKSS